MTFSREPAVQGANKSVPLVSTGSVNRQSTDATGVLTIASRPDAYGRVTASRNRRR